MWDYNVGLVRMTSFFKCRGYTKVSPAPLSIRTVLTRTDYAREDAQLEPGPQGDYLQHHGGVHQGTRCVVGAIPPSWLLD